MTKQMVVDVEKSIGYQANGRLKEHKTEVANLPIKKFICPNCHFEEEAVKKTFGEVRKCRDCKTVMLNQF